MRDILTGGALDQGYRSVPAVSSTAVWTLNITATVMLTSAPGEWTILQNVVCVFTLDLEALPVLKQCDNLVLFSIFNISHIFSQSLFHPKREFLHTHTQNTLSKN